MTVGCSPLTATVPAPPTAYPGAAASLLLTMFGVKRLTQFCGSNRRMRPSRLYRRGARRCKGGRPAHAWATTSVVTTTTRNAALPDVPTVADPVPGYEASVFYGVAGPKGMPPHIVATSCHKGVQRRAHRSRRTRSASRSSAAVADADEPVPFGKLLRRTRPREVGQGE